MADDQQYEQPPDFREIGKQFSLGLNDTEDWFAKKLANAETIQKVAGGLIGALIKIAGKLAVFLARTLMRAEDSSAQEFQELAAAGVEDLFGVKVNLGSTRPGGGRKLDAGSARQLGAAVLGVITNTSGATAGGSLQPSMAGAEGYLSNVLQMVFEGWLEGSIVDSLSLGYLGKFGDLDDLVYEALGFGRLSRRVLSPLVDATVVKPAEWHINRTYRPALLGESAAIRQYLAGKWTREQLGEELARQGYTDARIDALVDNAAKDLNLDDALVLVRYGQLDRVAVLAQLRAQGYDEQTATLALVAAEQKRAQSIRDDALAALRSAFIDRRLSESEFRTYLPAILYDEDDRDLYFTAATTMRAVNTRTLSLGQVEAAVEAGILAMPDYRAALEREGYTLDDALTLELLLRARLEAEFKADQAKRQALEQRAAADQVKRDAAAQKEQAAEQQRALARRGPISDLKRAVVRGLIPIARLEEVLAPEFDADTVAILVANVQADRQAYLDEQQQRADALKRAATRQIDVGSLEAAVLEHVLTVEQYQGAIAARGFPAADVAILTSTLRAKLADREAAQKQRDAADAVATQKHVNLSTFETLVRRGHRTIAQYDALLQSLGFDDVARAAMHELLQLEIDDDAAAAQARAAGETRLEARGLSVDEFRRAAVLGLKTIGDYNAFLVQQNFAPDVVALLVAEAERDRGTADAARQRRDATSADGAGRRLPLATVARAARLGVISLDAYRARLVLEGYTADDVELDVDLLVTEIAQARAAKAKAAAPAAPSAPPGPSLAELEAAVLAGTKTVSDYTVRAIELGFSQADVDELTAALQDALATRADEDARRQVVAGELAAAGVDLDALEAQVRDGSLALDAYRAELLADGVGADDADLLVARLTDQLTA